MLRHTIHCRALLKNKGPRKDKEMLNLLKNITKDLKPNRKFKKKIDFMGTNSNIYTLPVS